MKADYIIYFVVALWVVTQTASYLGIRYLRCLRKTIRLAYDANKITFVEVKKFASTIYENNPHKQMNFLGGIMYLEETSTKVCFFLFSVGAIIVGYFINNLIFFISWLFLASNVWYYIEAFHDMKKIYGWKSK